MATSTAAKKPRKGLPKKPANKTATDPAKVDQEVTSDVVTTQAALHPASPQVATVPPMTVADKYESRMIFGQRDFDTLDYAYENNDNVLIEGPTGCGKTMFTRAWAALRGLKVARIPSNSGIDASQLFGKFNPDESGDKGFVWIDGPVTYVFRYGGVILWNEINFTPERIGSVMFGALDDNREIVLLDHNGEVIRAHRGHGRCWCDLDKKTCNERRVLIVADMNPGYAGTRDLNDALRNRFIQQQTWDYDPVVESKLVQCPEVLNLATKIRADEFYETPVSTNMLQDFERYARDISVEYALGNFVNHFRPDEREPIKLVCETHKANIASFFAPASDDDDDDPVVVNDPDDAQADPQIDPDDLAQWIFTSDD